MENNETGRPGSSSINRENKQKVQKKLHQIASRWQLLWGKQFSRKTLTDKHTALATEAGHHQACVALQHQQIEEIFEPSTHIPSESSHDAFA